MSRWGRGNIQAYGWQSQTGLKKSDILKISDNDN